MVEARIETWKKATRSADNIDKEAPVTEVEDTRFYGDLLWMFLEKIEKLKDSERRMVVRFFDRVCKPAYLLTVKAEEIEEIVKKMAELD